MYSGIAVYDTEKLASSTACELAEKFFADISMPITGAGYYKMLKNGDHPGDHDIIEIAFSELKEKIKNSEVSAFRIYSEYEDVQPWNASFGYMTSEFGGFNYIDVQFQSVADDLKVTTEFLSSLSEKIPYSYGIKYCSDKVTKAFYYSTGDNMVNIYHYENSSLFKRECPGRFKGKERYKDTLLRMVYPVNVINNHHFNIEIGSVNLKEWILSDEKHGSLEELNNGMWLWTVEDDELDKLNKCLGEVGILISWKPPATKKKFGRLP